MKAKIGFLLIAALFMANTAQASLGPFNLTNGAGDNLIFRDDNGTVLNNTSTLAITGNNARWSPFKTEDFTGTGDIPGFQVLIDPAGAAPQLAMQKVTIQYFHSTGEIRIEDKTNRNGNPDMLIFIKPVTVPAVPPAPGAKPNDYMLTPSSVLSYFQGNPAVFQFSIANAAIPEPSAFLLGGLVLGMVGIRKRFAKKK